ncbi:hypothetical protein AXW84_19045 [Hymenobacter sp. PAMC 26628]|nr:hypothetical protein AXW84_19045 [Hymenobacter sp. PAMC 26628]
MIWNRRRANFLLITEMFLAFVVLFVVGSLLAHYQRNYRTPLGFAYAQVWRVDLDPGTQPPASYLATVRQVVARLRALPGVVAVARTSGNTPFSGSTNASKVGAGTEGLRATPASGHSVEDPLREVLQLPVVAGRWFDRRDDGAALPPAVLTRDLAGQLFPQQSPLGQVVARNDEKFRVVGVVERFRADGDLVAPRPALLMRVSPQDTALGEASTLLLRVQPGSGAQLERQMSTETLAIAKGWRVSITALPKQRAAQLKEALTPLGALVLVCVFLVVNVALGLFGVLWQAINQRRAELGVRRAMGATAGGISGQVVGEVLVLTTFGLLLGLLVAVQFPLLGAFNVPAGVYFTAMAAAAAGLYALAVGCALYPSRLAAGIQPAVALREE